MRIFWTIMHFFLLRSNKELQFLFLKNNWTIILLAWMARWQWLEAGVLPQIPVHGRWWIFWTMNLVQDRSMIFCLKVKTRNWPRMDAARMDSISQVTSCWNQYPLVVRNRARGEALLRELQELDSVRQLLTLLRLNRLIWHLRQVKFALPTWQFPLVSARPHCWNLQFFFLTLWYDFIIENIYFALLQVAYAFLCLINFDDWNDDEYHVTLLMNIT